MKSERIPVGVDAGEKAEIRRRAAAHGVSVAEFMRKAALGVRGGPEDDPDAWWDTKTAKRKKQIMRWESKRRATNQVQGQMPLLDEA